MANVLEALGTGGVTQASQRVFVSGISPAGEKILRSYLKEFAPNAEIELLKPMGIKGKIKNQGKRPNVILIILDAMTYDGCLSVASAVLEMPKSLRYENDEGLEAFLQERFGSLTVGADGASKANKTGTASATASTSVTASVTQVTNDVGSDADFDEKVKETYSQEEENFIEPKSIAEASIEEDMSSLSASVVTATEEKSESRVSSAELEIKDKEIAELKDRIAQMTSGAGIDNSFYENKIKELKADLELKSEELEDTKNKMMSDLGKIAFAEKTLGEYEATKKELKKAKSAVDELGMQNNSLTNKISSLSVQIAALEEEKEN